MAAVLLRAALAAVWLAALGALTLTPQPTALDPSLSRISLCLVCGERGSADALLNIVLFLPLGLLLGGRWRSPLGAAAVGLALSLSIEAAQYFIPGRYSNLGDVVWNASGAGLGAILLSSTTVWLPGSSRDAARLRAAAVLVVGGVTAAFGVLMEPSWPAQPYWGQWTPDLGWMPQYDGSVVRAEIDTLRIPPGRFPRRARPRDLLEGDWTLEATVVKGTPPSSLAPIVNIYDGTPREVVLVGALGEDLVYRERSRARVLRFDQPDLRLPGVMARDAVGDTMHLRVVRRGGERCLAFDSAGACPGFTPGRSWSLLLHPEGPPTWVRKTADVAWAFLLLIPVGFWSERPRHLGMSALAVAVLVGLAVATTRLAAPPLGEMAGAVAGLLGGRTIRFLVVGTGFGALLASSRTSIRSGPGQDRSANRRVRANG